MIKRGERVDENISFWSLLKTVKIRNLTWKYPVFYLAIVSATLSYFLMTNMNEDDLLLTLTFASNTLTSISASLMGIIIAGLAIIVALSMGNILHLLLRNKILQKLLFPFWFMTLFWSLSTITSISLHFSRLVFTVPLQIYIFSLEAFFFTYALFGTVGLIGSTIKTMLIIAQLKPKD